MPIEAVGMGELASYPIHVAGYTRGKMLMYDAVRIDCSIAYERSDSDLQQAITLYLYPRSTDETAQFAAEKELVLGVHPAGKHVSDERMELLKDGQAYPAHVATFEFEDTMNGRMQALSSQLVLITLPTRWVKVRSTAPLAQSEIAERGMLDLLDKLQWAILK